MMSIIEKLQHQDSIQRLKARYFRYLDTNDWQKFGETLTEDCIADYSDGELHFEGKDAIVDFMSENMSRETFFSMHNGHHPEIDIADDGVTATGLWYLQDMILDVENNFRLYGAGIYHDEYQLIDQQWLISKTGYSRTFECVEPLPEGHHLMKPVLQKNEEKK